LLQENITNLSLENIECTTLDEIAGDSIDQIWSNPPIRIGKQSLHELLMQAFSKLKAGGEAFLVVQKHLGSDSLAKWLETEQGHEVERLDNSKGFRVLKVTKK
jgi:16S rRNA G1207 methylase RsmC